MADHQRISSMANQYFDRDVREEQETERAWPPKPSIPFHPAAGIYGLKPVMTKLELEALAADIDANGLCDDKIELIDGIVIHGRNRLLALDMLGRDPHPHCQEVGDNADPYKHVISRVWHDKGLIDVQRALFVSALIGEHGGDRRSANFKITSRHLERLTKAQAIKKYGVSFGNLNRAAYIRQHAADNLLELAWGRTPWLTLNGVAAIASVPPEKQETITNEQAYKQALRAVRGEQARRRASHKPSYDIAEQVVRKIRTVRWYDYLKHERTYRRIVRALEMHGHEVNRRRCDKDGQSQPRPLDDVAAELIADGWVEALPSVGKDG
jgi:hypothetical protein